MEPTPTPGRPVAMKSLVRTVCLALVALVALACGSSESSASSARPVATPAGPLVTVTSRGGMCVGGPCGSSVSLDRDGRVHLAAKPPNDLGAVPPPLLQTLDSLIRTTDYAEIKAHPFTGQCPTAYDGQEYVIEFGAPGGIQRIASCEVAIDWGSPLFVAVSTALGPFVPLPTT